MHCTHLREASGLNRDLSLWQPERLGQGHEFEFNPVARIDNRCPLLCLMAGSGPAAIHHPIGDVGDSATNTEEPTFTPFIAALPVSLRD